MDTQKDGAQRGLEAQCPFFIPYPMHLFHPAIPVL